MQKTVYTSEFFESQQDGSLQSARLVIPLILNLIPCKRVVDVGCGTAAWLKVFEEYGIVDTKGVDGEYVDTKMLKIPEAQFIRHNLNHPLQLQETFDLVVSLEVAEHIQPDYASTFIASLTSLGSVVLFSAAIPGQRGTNHVNEQWPQYWIEQFRQHNYYLADCIRPRIWDNPKIEWWYAQNILLFISNGYACSSMLLKEVQDANFCGRALVHPRAFIDICNLHRHEVDLQNKPVRQLFKATLASMRNMIKRRITGF